MEEKELILKLKQNNNDAYKYLISRYQDPILNFCYRFVKDKNTAQDLAQDVFIEVVRSIDTFRMDSKLSTWLFRIAITKSLNYVSAQKMKKRFAFIKSLFFEDDNENEINIEADSESPHEILENKERSKILNDAIESLPENQRVAFTLCKCEDMSYKEISEILNTTVPAVESLIFRAKNNLQKKLSDYYKKIYKRG